MAEIDTSGAPDRIYIDPSDLSEVGIDGVVRVLCRNERVYKAEVEYLKATSAAHWVSVKDRLPEKDGWYFILNKDSCPLPTKDSAPLKDGHWGNNVNPDWITHWLSNVPSIPTEDKP